MSKVASAGLRPRQSGLVSSLELGAGRETDDALEAFGKADVLSGSLRSALPESPLHSLIQALREMRVS